uniref:Nck-associated protein 5 C-terminal domain-containing protein n=1 Tax=Pyxicephalus adspersus TaxID=30357 RepID=A0AAV3B0T3_PYXAD|nr:TPA: hypothetical protein GDO54_000709 [Pyxicephalus adspersus]
MTSEVEDEIRLISGGVSEPLVIQELVERLRELEAENSALAQANETQRETYERCLDEDLREECIKLKKRVFDLERQNRALGDLFHQKLQRSSGSSPELHPLQAVSDSKGGDLERLPVSLPLGQCAVQREEKQRSGRAQSTCRSLDAMSPFLRKKAQILEVLRRLEATGSQSASSCTVPSTYLGGLPSASGNGLRIRTEHGLDYLNGEGMTPPELGADEPWASCLLLAQNGWEELLKWKSMQREPPAGSPGEGGGEHLGLTEETQQSTRQAEGSSSSSDDDIGEPPPPISEIRQRLPLTDLAKGLAPCMCSRGAADKRGPVEGHSDGTGFSRGHIGHLHSLTCYSKNLHEMVENQHISGTSPAVTDRADTVSCSPGKPLGSELASNGPASSCPPPTGSSLSLPRDTGGLAQKSATQESQDDCTQPTPMAPNSSSSDPQDALVSSTESRTPHIPSPAKFLKFLKLPGSGEKSQSPNSLRLSPQLTQTSKIPCRSNNYEAFPSPRPSRKAAEEVPRPELDPDPPSPSELMNTDSNRQVQVESSNSLLSRSAVECCTKKSHDYENVPAKNPELSTVNQTVEELEGSSKLVSSVCSFGCSPGLCAHSQVNCTDDHHGQVAFNKKHVTSRKTIEPSPSAHLPFKEKMGKLRNSDSQQSEITVSGTENVRVITEGPDLRPSMKRSLAVSSLRTPEPGSTESYPPRYHGQKSDAARTRQPSTNYPPGSPHGPRNQPRAPPVPSKSPRSPHGSPTKLPAKSPSKATAKPLVSRPLSEELRPSPRQPTSSSEDKQRIQSTGIGKKAATCPEYACPRSAGPQGTESLPLSALHSAIEEKVMKGIKENMLRLQEQHRSPSSDPKQRNSSGIASWFGLKKSKLPALSRRPEAGRVKEEKRDRAAGGSPRTRDVKGESLNISMLMEKAEDLRKALQEERAYINGLSLDKNRTPVPVDQAPNQRSLTADNFMQQLLNRVDGKEPPLEGRLEGKTPLRDFPRLSPENKEARPFRPPRNGMVTHVQRCEQKSIDQNREVSLPPDERISESINSQHFAACDSLTRTLDSGIGTFPPPDYCGGTSNKIAPKLKPRLESPSVLPVGRFSAFPKVPRRARTLERDMRGVEEIYPPGQHQSIPAFHALLAEPEPTVGRRMYGEDSSRDHSLPQQSKNWTFPNSKISAGSAESFRSRVHDLEEMPSEGDRDCDMSGYAHPSICFPGTVSSRTPSTSEVGDEGTSEAKSRDNEQGQTGLENSESLSDSLYDSLSSCGSQG